MNSVLDELKRLNDEHVKNCPACQEMEAKKAGPQATGQGKALKALDDLIAGMNAKATAKVEADVKAKEQAARDKEAKHRADCRRAVTMAMEAVDGLLDTIPQSANGIAGWLLGCGYKGGLLGSDNALARRVRHQVQSEVNRRFSFNIDTPQAEVVVESDGIVVDFPGFQLTREVSAHVDLFMQKLRKGDYPYLVI